MLRFGVTLIYLFCTLDVLWNFGFWYLLITDYCFNERKANSFFFEPFRIILVVLKFLQIIQ